MMKRDGFTLIELLVVVAIIGILAAIAIVNLQGAMIKSKVARSQADIRIVQDALEMYRLDWNGLPDTVQASSGTQTLVSPTHVTNLYQFTTPVAYLSGGTGESPFSHDHGYWFYNWNILKEIDENHQPATMFWNSLNHPEQVTWMISSIGPNTLEFPYDTVTGGVVRGKTILFYDFNVTNGLNSRGLIQRHGR
ncbi:MAG: prepilin-type N-terminal cleavage/methylation domain-containing protein [bacterium]|nr:prepilin-type N-terminal cleavage/methylation domain-containing protein [bacterium]